MAFKIKSILSILIFLVICILIILVVLKVFTKTSPCPLGIISLDSALLLKDDFTKIDSGTNTSIQTINKDASRATVTPGSSKFSTVFFYNTLPGIQTSQIFKSDKITYEPNFTDKKDTSIINTISIIIDYYNYNKGATDSTPTKSFTYSITSSDSILTIHTEGIDSFIQNDLASNTINNEISNIITGYNASVISIKVTVIPSYTTSNFATDVNGFTDVAPISLTSKSIFYPKIQGDVKYIYYVKNFDTGYKWSLPTPISNKLLLGNYIDLVITIKNNIKITPIPITNPPTKNNGILVVTAWLNYNEANTGQGIPIFSGYLNDDFYYNFNTGIITFPYKSSRNMMLLLNNTINKSTSAQNTITYSVSYAENNTATKKLFNLYVDIKTTLLSFIDPQKYE